MARAHRFQLIDISNSFTKIAFARGRRISGVRYVPTARLSAAALKPASGGDPLDAVVISSVVPAAEEKVLRALGHAQIIRVSADIELGMAIEYRRPETIGADRLANAVAASTRYGTPCIAIDIGTAATFDVVSPGRVFVGGVIAPGPQLMTDYLHQRTAQLPAVEWEEPPSAVGRSTREAILAGAVHGFRGMVREIVGSIRREAFPRRSCKVVATGGYAPLIAAGLPEIDEVDPRLTLEGLRIIGELNFAG